jgi:hypothetical protein
MAQVLLDSRFASDAWASGRLGNGAGASESCHRIGAVADWGKALVNPWRSALIVSMFVLAGMSASAQTNTGEIGGVVKDSNGGGCCWARTS